MTAAGWVLAAGLVAGVVAAVFFVPIDVHITLRVRGLNWSLRAVWRAPGGLVVWRNRWMGRFGVRQTGSTARRLRRLGTRITLKSLRALAPWAPLLTPLRFGRPETATVTLRLGTGDAAWTARAAGAAWGFMGAGLTAFTGQFGSLRRPARVRVDPDYRRAVLDLRARCIVRSAPRDIIIALLWMLMARVMNRRGGVRQWKGIPSKA